MELLDSGEALIPLLDTNTLLPVKATAKTLRVWAKTGILGPNGERVRLETVRVGGKVFTSREAIQRFLAGCNVPRTAPEDVDTEAALAELKREGVA